MANEWELDEHWKVINAGGREISTSPHSWWEAAVDYFKWADEHPIKASRTLTSGKTQGEKVTVEYKRPYSIKAMCLHCNISERWMLDIKNSHNESSEWLIVLEKILSIIYTQNLEGAIVDLYNPIMVSKVLNMDKGDNEESKAVRVEIVDSISTELSQSENEVIAKLDQEKLVTLKQLTDEAQVQTHKK